MEHLTFGFIGLGLIGGSVAKALKLAAPDCKIIAFDKNTQALTLAKEEKTADIICSDVNDSFSSCDVIPEIEEDVDIEILDKDLRIDTYRASGAGGQHVNKTSSAIRITHLPTGIVVQCQNERSQHMNKDKAMQMLKAKLFLLKQQENEEKASDIRGEVKEIGWGNQIRSYVMQPYKLVKDHRTNTEISNVDSVMDGNIDPFINAFLKWRSIGKNKTE